MISSDNSNKASVIFKMFIWSYDPVKNNDKIWGYAEVAGKYYSFWGKRGNDIFSLKKLRFKLADDVSHLADYGKKKLRGNKGYQNFSTDSGPNKDYPEIEKIYPGFVSHMREQLMLARLQGTIIIRKELYSD